MIRSINIKELGELLGLKGTKAAKDFIDYNNVPHFKTSETGYSIPEGNFVKWLSEHNFFGSQEEAKSYVDESLAVIRKRSEERYKRNSAKSSERMKELHAAGKLSKKSSVSKVKK